MKNISLIFGGVLTIIACNAYAVTATVTSRDYVDNALATKQAKIPSAGTAGAPTGDSVITYTASSGTIGERGLYTDSSEYDASADSDKLITASALNTAFTTLPETETTKLQCTDSNCLLWNIVTQTAYGISGNGTTTIDLMSIIGNVAGIGYTSNDSSGDANDTDGMSNSIISGDPMAFAVDYGVKGMIKGHGRCSSQEGDNNNWTWTNPTVSSTLPDSSGQYCYCTLEGYTPLNGTMTTLSAPWVFSDAYGDASVCADDCASFCAGHLWADYPVSLAFRSAVFNSVQ